MAEEVLSVACGVYCRCRIHRRAAGVWASRCLREPREAADARENQAHWIRPRAPDIAVVIMADQSTRSVTKWQVVFGVLIALAFTVLGALSLWKTVALLRSESVAVARVVESPTVTKRRGGVSYEVRYVFAPAPGLAEIRRGDFLGRANLWSSLPEQDWQAATAAKQVKVRFEPGDPGNNAPTVSLPGVGDSIIILVLGVGFGVTAICGELHRRGQLSAK